MDLNKFSHFSRSFSHCHSSHLHYFHCCCYFLLSYFENYNFILISFIPDDGHEDRNVETIPLMDLCEMLCSLECRQVACKLFKYLTLVSYKISFVWVYSVVQRRFLMSAVRKHVRIHNHCSLHHNFLLSSVLLHFPHF